MSNLLNIILASQDGVTLSTEGTYCDKNIKIVPLLEDKTVAATKETQTIFAEEGYAGIGSVTIEGVSEYEGLVTVGGEPVNVQGGIIEVDELPTEGIEMDAFYLCNGEYYRYVDGEWVKYLVPSGSLTITENAIVDVTDKAEVIVNVPSIIEVDELPTEDIDTNAVYSCNGDLYRYGKGEGVVGTWVLNETLTSEPFIEGNTYEFFVDGYMYGAVSPSNTQTIEQYPISSIEYKNDYLYIYGNTDGVSRYSNYVFEDNTWYAAVVAGPGAGVTMSELLRTIVISNPIADETFVTWIKANAAQTEIGYEWVQYKPIEDIPNAEDYMF